MIKVTNPQSADSVFRNLSTVIFTKDRRTEGQKIINKDYMSLCLSVLIKISCGICLYVDYPESELMGNLLTLRAERYAAFLLCHNVL